MRRFTPVLLAGALVAAACGAKASDPPEIVVDRTACSHCTMLVSDVTFASAYRMGTSDARVFDDIGCMLDAMKRAGVRPGAPGLRVWVHDATDGRWIPGDTALFVKSPQIKTPMGGGILAYGDGSAASRTANETHGEILRSLTDLADLKGAGQ